MHARRLLLLLPLMLVATWPADAQSQKPAQPAASTASAAQPGTAAAAGYGVKLGGFFTDEQRQIARRYYAQRYAKGKECPEGMERVGKAACKAPVEGRYWAVGQPLQKAVDTYPLPDALKSQLPAPPEGYEYLRAGDDILLVSKGLRLVVDMIEHVMG